MTFRVKQEKFEGPLELLLDLIEKEKMSVSEISLAQVTDEYLKYIKSLEAVDMEKLAEFLVVAAQLILIKSRSLLPHLRLSEEEEQSIEELEKRLEEYKRLREFAKELRGLEVEKRRIITHEAYFGMEAFFYPPPKLAAKGIKDAFASFLAALPKIEKLVEEKIRRVVSLEEKIAKIKDFLQYSIEKTFSEIVGNARDKIEVIVSFLALLELAKQKIVDLRQEKPFEEIVIKKNLE